MSLRPTTVFTALFLLAGCSSDDKPDDATAGGGGNPPSGGSNSGAGKPSNFGGGIHTGPMFAGAECPTDVGFPDAYALPNLKGAIDGSNVRITFDPQGDAKDYRVYALPKAGDVIGSERFLDDANPWSFSLLMIIPLAPLAP